MKQTTLISTFTLRVSHVHTPRAGVQRQGSHRTAAKAVSHRCGSKDMIRVYRAGSEAALFVLLLPFLAADGDAGAMLSATKAAAALARRKSEAELSVSAS